MQHDYNGFPNQKIAREVAAKCPNTAKVLVHEGRDLLVPIFGTEGAISLTPNLGAAVTNSTAAITASSPALNFSINFANGNNYHVWVKMYASNNGADTVHVALNNNAALTATTATYNSWVWVDAGNFGTISGTQTIHLYMAEDGIKIDKIYLFAGSTTAAHSVEVDLHWK